MHDPVSYTHLDVYKRQLPTTPRELLVSRMITNVIVWWMLLITIAMLRNQVRGCLLYTSRCV